MFPVRNLLLMGSSTAVRLVFGLLTFVVMARLLGPHAFGTVMLWLSVATLLSLLASFGLTPYVLREIGARPPAAARVMAEVLTARLLLAGVVLGAAVGAMPFIQGSARLVFLLLLGAQLADSLTEFLNVGFRATGRFGAETRLAAGAALVQSATVSGFVLAAPTEVMAAAGFLVSRLLVLYATWSAQRRHLEGLRPGSLAAGVARLRQGLSYATDFGLQSLFGQVDSVVLNQFVGLAAVGTYQAGMRLFAGSAQAASVLGNVFLPRSAAAVTEPGVFRRESHAVQYAFLFVGLFLGLFFAAFPKQITAILFGSGFVGLEALLPWFGLLFFVRFFASSWGILLTSAGLQRFRAWANAVQWIFVFALALHWIPRFGAVGWLMALVCGNLLLGLSYLARSSRLVPPGLRTTALTAVGGATFVPFVSYPLALTP